MTTDPTAPIPVDVRGLPKWLQAAVFLGVPSVIAMFLVYYLTIGIAERVNVIERQQALQAQTIALIAKAQADRQADADQTREHFDQLAAQLMRAITRVCINITDSPQERASCVTPTKEYAP